MTTLLETDKEKAIRCLETVLNSDWENHSQFTKKKYFGGLSAGKVCVIQCESLCEGCVSITIWSDGDVTVMFEIGSGYLLCSSDTDITFMFSNELRYPDHLERKVKDILAMVNL